MSGGPGDDSLFGASGVDRLDGQDGNDLLDGGADADNFTGGTGNDAADYRTRTAPLLVTVDGSADDGEAGERDLVATDIEAVYGGGGSDTITAGGASLEIQGGAGDDVLTGGAAGDVIRAGAGNDLIDGGGAADVIVGDDGQDTVSYALRQAPVSATLGDTAPTAGEAGEGDSIDTSEVLVGGSGADRLVSTGGISVVLDGRAGNDTLISDEGVSSDELRCGLGSDVARVDRTDTVSGDCERVVRSGVVVRPTAPMVFQSSRAARVSATGRVALVLACSLRTLGYCNGPLKVRFRAAGRVGYGSGSLRLLPGERERVVLRLSARSLRLLKRSSVAPVATVSVRLTDSAGHVTKQSLKVTLRKPVAS